MLEPLTTTEISLIHCSQLQFAKEQYPLWVAMKGIEKEYGHTADEAFLKLCEKLNIPTNVPMVPKEKVST